MVEIVVSLNLDSEKAGRQVEFVREANILDVTPFYLQFDPKDGKTSSRPEIEDSLRDYFGNKFGRFLINSERQTLRGLQIPIISLDNVVRLVPTSTGSKRENGPRSLKNENSSGALSASQKQEVNVDHIEDLLEWIGAMHCRARSYVEGQPIDSEVSTMNADHLERAPMHGLTFRHEGFLITSWVQHQITQAKSIIDAGMSPYAIVTAWAFVDQPLQNVHYFRDAHFSIIILPGDMYILSSPML